MAYAIGIAGRPLLWEWDNTSTEDLEILLRVEQHASLLVQRAPFNVPPTYRLEVGGEALSTTNTGLDGQGMLTGKGGTRTAGFEESGLYDTVVRMPVGVRSGFVMQASVGSQAHITAVPEPHQALLLTAGATALWSRRRRSARMARLNLS